MNNTKLRKTKKWIPIVLTVFLTIALFAGIFIITDQFGKPEEKSTNVESSEKPTNSQEDPENNDTTSVDNMMSDFQGTDEEVIQICETELQALDIEFTSIDEPLEGAFIQETRVGTYELNGILRTPNNSPDMKQPKSTEMLCTIFPGDEYPVEITFGKDW